MVYTQRFYLYVCLYVFVYTHFLEGMGLNVGKACYVANDLKLSSQVFGLQVDASLPSFQSVLHINYYSCLGFSFGIAIYF